tara:strand:- start:72 stop:335 length:264 start_codon:yes stop_codon:yes gene_type:complete
MKLKQLKKILNSLGDNELKEDLIIISNEKTYSNFGDAKKSKSHLINVGDDDPCELCTKTELIEDGYSKEEIEEFDVVIKRGQFYIES